MASPSSASGGKSTDSHATSSTSTTAAAAAAADSDAELGQAFRDIARGEQTAQALESNLTSLERKLDDLLASFEESERLKVEAPNGDKTHGEAADKKS